MKNFEVWNEVAFDDNSRGYGWIETIIGTIDDVKNYCEEICKNDPSVEYMIVDSYTV